MRKQSLNSTIENPPVTLSTNRLTLRRITVADTHSYFDIFSNVEVMRYGSKPALADLKQAEERIANIFASYDAGDAYVLAITRKSDDKMIGTCTLHQIHAQNRRAEVGYALARAYWGQGYMNEAMHALVDYAFVAMKLHRLEADIDPRNEASAKSLERLGFSREGYLRERWIVCGEISDSALYGLLASEWQRPATR